ncbi:MAG: glutamine amidotransferase [Planctomycetota bacterium]
MIDWSLSPVFGSYALLGMVALGMFFILMFVQDEKKLEGWQRAVLWILRLLLCLFLLLTLLRPGLTFTREREPRGTVAILMDSTASMQLSSGEGKRTRWESQLAIWDALWEARGEFGKEVVLAPFLYDSKLKGLGEIQNTNEAARPELPKKPEGGTTDIGGPLSQLASTSLNSPLSAVIWMGDGAQTLSPAGTDPQQVVRQFARLDIPMYLIGLGPRSDSENARDIAVEGIPEQLDVYTKNQIFVRGMLKSRGVANRDINIALWMVGRDGASRLVDRTLVRPTKSEQSLAFQIPLIAPEAGSYELIVKAEPVEGEAVTENNEATAYLNVRGGGARVLYLEGEPRTEAKFIASALLESPDIQVDRRWIAREPIQKWPVDLTQQLASGVYDLFILGDLDSDAIGVAGAKLIADQVNRGAGLITLGGYYTYAAGGWDRTALADVLPIQMGVSARQKREGPLDLRGQYPGSIKLIPVASDKLLQIGEPGSDVAKLWSEMKPLTGATRWDGIKNAPGVKLLAQGDGGQPLIVLGTSQQGRVLSIAFDSTYQWMRQGKVKEFKQFWRQLALWGLRRELVEEGLQLSMSQRRLYLQQNADVIVQWNPGTNDTPMPKTIFMHLWKLGLPKENGISSEEDLGEFPLQRRDAMSMKLRMEGIEAAGRYEWRAKTSGAKGKQIEAKLPFIVMDQSVESMQPMPDWQLLGQLAKLNEPAGGELMTPDQTAEVVRKILERRKQATETAIENFKLGDTDWDSWGTFLVVAGLLVTQWILRKRWGLP